MSLTYGDGPLSPRHAPENFILSRHATFAEPWDRRLRAFLGDRTLVDTERAMMLHESGGFPAMWVPLADVNGDLIRSNADRDGAPAWGIVAGDRVIEGAVTGYRPAGDAIPELRDYVTVAFDAADRWFNEDDPVYAHFKDSYHRVDVFASSRHVVVRHNGTVIADSRRPRLLYETSVPTRYYLPFIDTNLALLSLSETVSECPYKGDGQHWHVTINGERIEDAAWSLPHPLPEAFAAAEHICFYADKVEVEVDGERARQ